jgi:hypothetical protein
MTTSVETTSGISTRNYQEKTPLEIMQDLTRTDKAVFWLPLGSTQVTYKYNFNTADPTNLTDADVISWSGGEYDYTVMRNEVHITGIRVANDRIYYDSDGDAGAASKTKYGRTRTESIAGTGIVSEYEAENLGKNLVNRDDEVLLYLNVEIAGLSSIRLGDEREITSSVLGMAATTPNYVVTNWKYNSETYRTTLTLHPQSTIGYVERTQFGEHMRFITDETQRARRETYAPGLHTETW